MSTADRESASVRCCPDCGHSHVWARETKSPTYRCVHGHEFDDPEWRDLCADCSGLVAEAIASDGRALLDDTDAPETGGDA